MLDNLIILLLIVLAFIAGKKTSDSYNHEMIDYLTYQLRLNSAEKTVGYVAPLQRKKVVPIGQPFMDRLKEHGHATQTLRSPHT